MGGFNGLLTGPFEPLCFALVQALFLSLRIQGDPEDGRMVDPAFPKLDLLQTPSAEHRITPGGLHSTIGTGLTFARIHN
jgi:hypothetical protein